MTNDSLTPTVPLGGTIPIVPGAGPHDGQRPLPWWKFDGSLIQTLQLPDVRGLGSQSPLSAADFKTFSDALLIIKSNRTKLVSTDTATAQVAASNLLSLVSYLAGLLDARHVPTAAAGVTGLAPQPEPSDLDTQLDELEHRLAAVSTPTRGPGLSLLLVGLGTGLILIGAGIKGKVAQMPDTLPD